MGRRIALLSSAAAGPGLYVREGALKAMTIDPALDIHRRIEGDLAAASGIYTLEVAFYSDSLSSWANLASFGVTQPGDSLDKYVGETANSYGWRWADGRIDNNNAAIRTGILVQPERVVLGLYLFLTPSIATLSFTVNGTSVSTAISLPTNKLWLPAFSMGSAVAGDNKFQVNFGQYLFDVPLDPTGWNEQTAGLSTFYISLITEHFMSASTDTPANQNYLADLINSQEVYMRRAPLTWVDRIDPLDTAPIPSVFAPLVFRNTKENGYRYSPLLAADTRDSIVTLDTIEAPAMAQGSLASAVRMLTANIDSVLAPNATSIQVNLKDAIATLDGPMPMKLVWDFYDDSAAGKSVPWGIGTQRNFQPLTLDGEALLLLLGDMPFTNVPLVMDLGAPLDPLSPQYVPALSGRGITLNQPPEGTVTCDGSTQGSQYVSGRPDILSGVGAFTTWTAGVPNGWAKPTNPPFPLAVVNNGSISQVAFGTHASALRMVSNVPYTPGLGVGYGYGYPLFISAGAVLQPGKTYRFSFNLLECIGTWPEKFGIMILSGAADDERYHITPFRTPCYEPGLYSFEYTVPAALGALSFGVYCVAKFGGTAPTTFACISTIDDFVVEELGQFVDIRMLGATVDAAMGDILVRHCNRPGLYSAASAQALHNATVDPSTAPNGYVWGVRKFDPPNTPNVMQEILDAYCGGMFTNELNQILFGRMMAPEDGTSVCLFTKGNIDPDEEFSLNAYTARGLTTIFGARRNNDPLQSFVTDTGIVPVERRTQLSETSQFHVDATVLPATEYAHALGAPRFHTLHDDPALCLIEGNRVLRIFAQRVVGGLIQSGKRQLLKFTANYEGLSLGMGPTIQPQKLYPFSIVTIDVPEAGLSMKQGLVLSTELYPFARKIVLEVMV